MSKPDPEVLFTRALLVLAVITVFNVALGAVIVVYPATFLPAILAWAISGMVWFDLACRTLLDKGERPWH